MKKEWVSLSVSVWVINTLKQFISRTEEFRGYDVQLGIIGIAVKINTRLSDDISLWQHIQTEQLCQTYVLNHCRNEQESNTFIESIRMF